MTNEPQVTLGFGYIEATVFVDGAVEETFYSTPANDPEGRNFDIWLQNVEHEARQDMSVVTEVFIIDHPHPMADGECACVQYLTDHHPAYAWGGDVS